MIADPLPLIHTGAANTTTPTFTSVVRDFHPSALAEIYRPEINLAIWQRHLAPAVIHYAKRLTQTAAHWQTRFIQTPAKVAHQLAEQLPVADNSDAFIADLELVVDMFACLFELKEVGVRLAVLRSAMCPKFHVDRVPCRLLCTYTGAGSEWLRPEEVQRSDNSVYPLVDAEVKQLHAGEVALLKGESWEGNEGRGLVHRSPRASDENPRLVLTLDFA